MEQEAAEGSLNQLTIPQIELSSSSSDSDPRPTFKQKKKRNKEKLDRLVAVGGGGYDTSQSRLSTNSANSADAETRPEKLNLLPSQSPTAKLHSRSPTAEQQERRNKTCSTNPEHVQAVDWAAGLEAAELLARQLVLATSTANASRARGGGFSPHVSTFSAGTNVRVEDDIAPRLRKWRDVAAPSPSEQGWQAYLGGGVSPTSGSPPNNTKWSRRGERSPQDFPQRKTVCSYCNQISFQNANFCPNCGSPSLHSHRGFGHSLENSPENRAPNHTRRTQYLVRKSPISENLARDAQGTIVAREVEKIEV